MTGTTAMTLELPPLTLPEVRGLRGTAKTPDEALRLAAQVMASGFRCRGAFARDAEGNKTMDTGTGACAWCAVGALCFVSESDRSVIDAWEAVEKGTGFFLTAYADRPDVTDDDLAALLLRAAGAVAEEPQ